MTNEYSGSDITLIMLGRSFAAISVKYSEKQDKKNKYVLGSDKPYSRTRGNKEYEGEITLPQSEFEALQKSLPAGKSITDIAPFQVQILYLDKETSVAIVDVWKDAEFMDMSKEAKVGSDGMDVPLKLTIGDVILQAK